MLKLGRVHDGDSFDQIAKNRSEINVFWGQKNVKNLPGPPQGLQLPPQRPAKMDLFSTLNNVLFSIATDPPCNTQK